MCGIVGLSSTANLGNSAQTNYLSHSEITFHPFIPVSTNCNVYDSVSNKTFLKINSNDKESQC